MCQEEAVTISISVVIPVHNGGSQFHACLEQLAVSTWRPDQIIVVDDGSTDSSAERGRRFGASVFSTGGPYGPAYARNLGARKAVSRILLFLDADVAVHADTLERVALAFEGDSELAALIGSYDDSPASLNFLSQYRNLMHHFVHQCARQEAFTFWGGCGAIQRTLFLELGGFQESYRRPTIEDIEFGYRLRQAGCKIVLDRRLQVKHLKRWTFFELVRTDVFDRGIPWAELILRNRRMPNDLNLRISQRLSVVLVFVLAGLGASAAIYWGSNFLVPTFAFLFFLMGHYWLNAADSADSRVAMLASLGSAALLAWLAGNHHMPGLIPPALLASVLIVTQRIRGAPYNQSNRGIALCLVAMLAVGFIATLIYLPAHPIVVLFFLTALFVILLNAKFYAFLTAKRGMLFALAALPFHLLFFFYSGLSFMIAIVKFGSGMLPERNASCPGSSSEAAIARRARSRP